MVCIETPNRAASGATCTLPRSRTSALISWRRSDVSRVKVTMLVLSLQRFAIAHNEPFDNRLSLFFV